MAEKILIVDDEESLADFVARALRQHGYKTICAYDGDSALNMIGEELPDLVILDLMLPMMDGWEVCRRSKADLATRNIPIIMLTARSSSEDVVQGLDLGADDYIRKPFPLEELLARVRVMLRRTHGDGDGKVLIDGDLTLDVSVREARLRGTSVELSPTEFDILEILTRRMGHTVSREELLKKIWGMGGGDTRTVDVHISRLRKKIDDGATPMLVAHTLRGRGYRLAWEEYPGCMEN
ncbi:response regulator transcription factor [Synergistaceae bacterium OttesenSCG-928-D05]|nr:response regulator transcription factor [Synergistaceae bacterium OttesenSCG-928-D05]